MRPNWMTMKNFITYKDETIDFNQLGSNVFLISGKTGCGKTTIFDAMMFALYGEASGSKREAKALFSNFADRNEKSEVRLNFTHNGKDYTVTRTLSFSKKRGTGEYEFKSPEAVLEVPDGLPISGASKVTNACEDIIGFNADQFKRIVMLAQGEFKRFLEAKDDEREKILSNLFDISAHKRYQTLLTTAAKRLEDERKSFRLERAHAFQGLKAPEGLSPELAAKLNDGHPEGMATLSALVAEEEQQLSQTEAARADSEQRIIELNRRRTQCKNDNAALDALESKRGNLLQLEARQDEMRRAKEAADIAERALRSVKPAMDACDDAEAKRAKTAEALREKRAGKPTAEKERDEAAIELQAAKAQLETADELKRRRDAITKELPLYADRAAKAKQLEETRSFLTDAAKRLSRLQSDLTAAREEKATTESRLSELQDIGERALEKSQQLEKLQGQLKKLSELVQLDREAGTAEAELETARRRLARLLSERDSAKHHWDELDRVYSAGIAGELAAQLGEALKMGDAACPVCRTQFKAGSYSFAVRASDSVKKSDVNKAKAAFETADREYNSGEISVQKKVQLLSGLTDQTLKAAREFFPELSDRAQLTTEGLIDRRFEVSRDEERQLKAELKRISSLTDERRRLSARLSELQVAEKKLGDDIDRLKLEIGEKQRDETGLETELKSIVLTFMSRGDAESAERRLAGQIAQIVNRHQLAEQRANSAGIALASIEGEISQIEATLEQMTAEAEAAVEALNDALARNGFADRASAAAVMHDEAWLKAAHEDQVNYAAKLKNAEDLLAEMLEQTKGLVRTDLTAVDLEIEREADISGGYLRQINEFNQLLGNHRRALEIIVRNNAELAKTERAYERLKHLSQIAGGEITGKITFARYALGADFKEVLERANARLTALSDGHFTLIHRVEQAKGNQLGGLGIDVCDMYTGKTESCGSLSGGESFMTSLSLALGLADVVQARAGGNSLETVFIDEGFGTLDEDALQNAIDVLKQLSNGDRMVGIISHVSELETAIPIKVRVSFNRQTGSKIKIVSE